MTRIERRIRILEKALLPKSKTNPLGQIQERALERLEIPDLDVLAEYMSDVQQNGERALTEAENEVVLRFKELIDDECRVAGYASAEELSGIGR